MNIAKAHTSWAVLLALSLGCTGELDSTFNGDSPGNPKNTTGGTQNTTGPGQTNSSGGGGGGITTSGGGTNVGGGGGPAGAVLPEFRCLDEGNKDPGPPLLRRLTLDEYINTVEQTLGVNIASSAASTLPSDGRADGFSNTAYNLKVNFDHVTAYAQLAEEIVGKLKLGEFAKVNSSCQDLGKSECVDSLVNTLGQKLWRGPVESVERQAFDKVLDAVKAEGGDFNEFSGWLAQAMLQSPRFLYRVEYNKGDGTIREIDGWEMASRLSYMLWGGPPDQALYDAAQAGELQSFEQIKAQAQRMLKDSKARDVTKRFAYEWLGLSRVKVLAPDAEEFPEFKPQLKQAMIDETLMTIDHIFWDQKKPVGALFDSQVSFLSPELATYYGVKDVPQGPGSVEVDLSGEPTRSGLLNHASLLTTGGYEASMVGRGLFLMRNLLCADVSDPPPGADTTPKPSKPGVSQRMLAEERVADSGCGGCHSQFEPLAYGLERYDGLGGYHDMDEHGNALRADGSLKFSLREQTQSFQSSQEVGKLFAKSDVVDACFTLKVTQFALGRPLLQTDRCTLVKIRQQVKDGGNDFASLMAAIATSDLMRTMKTEQ